LRPAEIALAAILLLAALLPLAQTEIFAALIGLLFGAALAGWLVDRARELIGGYSGDVLGATEQLFEVGFLLGVAAVLKG
jgi:adenosylcobinamide-GDP ribazoletransferase